MKIRTHEPTTHERWAQLRFSVVGHLLAAPPARGDLQLELERLAEKKWRHPVTGAPTTFGVSTIERWYYEAKRAPVDPVGRLLDTVRRETTTAYYTFPTVVRSDSRGFLLTRSVPKRS